MMGASAKIFLPSCMLISEMLPLHFSLCEKHHTTPKVFWGGGQNILETIKHCNKKKVLKQAKLSSSKKEKKKKKKNGCR